MDPTEPILRFFAATDLLLERLQPNRWGAVVTDSRFPAIWDLNYARVDRPRPRLSLKQVEAALLPALRQSGATHEHVVMFEPERCTRLLRDLSDRGHQVSWEFAMQFGGPTPEETGTHQVHRARLDDTFWRHQRLAYREFEVTDPIAVDQLIRWSRDVLAPAGRRWFTVAEQDGTALAGMGSLQVRERVAYIDDVVTFEPARRQGVATAIVTRLIREARAARAEAIFLLADAPGPIRLYERLGFRATGRIASSLAPLA